MLCRIALKNIKKSFRDYAIYFFTLVIGVSVFYVFNAIEDQTTFLIISNDRREMAEMLGTILSSLSVFVAVILGLLIVYASRFLMKRRNNEFATYLLLGMSKGNIAVIMFVETIIIGLISLFFGLLIGVGLSQLMSAVVANLFEADMSSFKFIVSSGAIVKTILNFAMIYVVVIIFDTFMVGKTRLISLIQSARRGEKVRLKNPALCTVIFIAAAITLGYAYHMVLSRRLGIANMNMKELGIAIALGAVSTFFIFWSISGLLLRIVMLMRRTYFKRLNSFTVRQLSSSINTMVFSMSIICLLLFFTISGLSAAFSLRNTLNGNLRKYAPSDAFCMTDVNRDIPLSLDGTSGGFVNATYDAYGNITETFSVEVDTSLFEGMTPYEIWQQAGNSSDENLNKLADLMADMNKRGIDSYFGNGIDEYFKEKVVFRIYNAPGFTTEEALGTVYDRLLREDPEEAMEISGLYNYDTLIRVSDYNALARLKGYKQIDLSDDEYAIMANVERALEVRNEALKAGTVISVYGKELRPKDKKCIEGAIELSSNAENAGVYIVPDEVIDSAGCKAMLTGVVLTGNYRTDLGLTDEEIDKDITDILYGKRATVDESNSFLYNGMRFSSKREIYNSSIGFGATATFLALYLGIVFLITSAVILALKALSDSLDSLERYEMLRRIGADEKDITRSLLHQQGIFFLLPMLLAVFHSIFGIKFINKSLVIFGQYHILGSIIFTSLIIGLIYGGYFVITYSCSRQIIRGRR